MTPLWPRVLAHRGASGQLPENSLAAFREAVRLGADGVELDVHTSASGHLVVHHDAVIPGLGPIRELKWEEIRTGRPEVPILEEVLAGTGSLGLGDRGLEFWIEVKALPRSADATLLAAIDGCPIRDGCAVHSFDHRIVARLGEQRPALRRGVLQASYPVDPLAPMRAAGARTLWQEWHLIDAELVDAVHRSGGEVIAWTVNDRASAGRLAALGVDGLCGNWPERLRSE